MDIRFPPSIFPVNSVKAMRACCWLLTQPGGAARMEAFAEAVFSAYWTQDRDIAQDAELADIATGQGIDAAALLAAIATPEVKALLKSNVDEVIARGGFETKPRGPAGVSPARTAQLRSDHFSLGVSSPNV